jgi:hypothetical protein
MLYLMILTRVNDGTRLLRTFRAASDIAANNMAQKNRPVGYSISYVARVVAN